jgi:hypothetical protein
VLLKSFILPVPVSLLIFYYFHVDLFVHNAGSRGNNTAVSCSNSETIETIVIMVTLPMTKSAFIANQDKYIISVARTAGINPENVKILSIEEVSTRSPRIISARLLLATSVNVQTSVLISTVQQIYIKDQSLLNRNLVENGLPSGKLVIQDTYKSVLNSTTPAPVLGGDDSSGL